MKSLIVLLSLALSFAFWYLLTSCTVGDMNINTWPPRTSGQRFAIGLLTMAFYAIMYDIFKPSAKK